MVTASSSYRPATRTPYGKKLLTRLRKRVDWAKAFKLAAKSSLTLTLPSAHKLVELVKSKADAEDDVRGMDSGRR
jgi:hypothetical protein